MPANPKPNPLDAHLGFWLRYVSNHVSARFQKLLEEQGTTVTEWVALRTLYDRKTTTHSELIEALGMTKGAASKVISRLEEKEWATRELADGSAREQLLRLTAAGRRLVPRLAAQADANEAHFFGHMSGKEREMLMQAFQSLANHHQLRELPVA